MRLEKYFKVKGCKSLTGFEMVMFKVRDQCKGWPNRYKENTIDLEMLERIYNHETCTLKTRIRIRNYTVGKEKERERASPDLKCRAGYKMVYLIVNENGRVKIGISEKPRRRASELSTGSGYVCKLLCYWNPIAAGRDVEKMLHDKFSSYRLLGEWFREDVPIKEIVSLMSSFGYARLDVDKVVMGSYI